MNLTIPRTADETARRVTGHGDGEALVCAPISGAVAMPPIRTSNVERRTSNIEGEEVKGEGERRWDGVAVLERRVVRRNVDVAILEELAEQQLLRNDFNGFRRISDRVWKVKMHNFRVMNAVLRLHVVASQTRLMEMRGGAL